MDLAKNADIELYISKDDRNQILIQQLAGTEITVHEVDAPLPNFILMNDSLVWFGKIPMMTPQHAGIEELLLRIESEHLAQELRELIKERSKGRAGRIE